jgi:very-short-patch-repair endonuclease
MPNNQLHNKPVLKKFRKTLRNHGTTAEAVMWTLLKGKQLHGRKFRRQHSVGYYILDFYSPQEKLAIELDGAAHFTKIGIRRDGVRTKFLNGLGIRIIRFENKMVFRQTEEVLKEIEKNFATPDLT